MTVTTATDTTASTTHPEPRCPGEAYDVLTVLTLLLGGFLVPVVGWLAGVVLLWGSPRWGTGQKWLGTLVWPGVVVAPLVPAAIGAALGGSTGWFVAAAVVGVLGLLVVLPAVFVHLLRARRTA